MDSNPYETPAGADNHLAPSALVRLRGRHLAIWFATLVLLFGWHHRLYSAGLADTGIAEHVLLLTELWDSLYGATMLTTAAVLIESRRSEGLQLQPGHWIVLIEAAVVVMGILAASLSIYWLVPWFLFAACVIAARANVGLWRWAFIALAAMPILEATRGLLDAWFFRILTPPVPAGESLPPDRTWMASAYLHTLFLAIPPLLMVIAAFRERWRSSSRDWAHWLGVGTCVLRLATLLQGLIGLLQLTN